MKITIEIYQDIKKAKEAYENHYGKRDKKPTKKDLKSFFGRLVECDLDAIMCTEPS